MPPALSNPTNFEERPLSNFFEENNGIKEITARVNRMDSVVIIHDALRETIEGIKQCVAWSETAREPKGAVLTGIGGVGKTTVCRAILKTFRSYESTESDKIVRVVPAYYAAIPAPSTIRGTITKLLGALGDPHPASGSAHAATERLINLLNKCRTKLILLDEFHHLLGASEGKTEKNVCKWIKALVNDSGVMICLIGIPRCLDLLKLDDEYQLGRRFTRRFRLEELSAGLIDAPGPLVNFVQVLSNRCKELVALDEFLSFAEFVDVERIKLATGGNPSAVVELFKEAMFSALRSGRGKVTHDDFAAAFAKGVTLPVAQSAQNAFLLSTSGVRKLVALSRKK